MIMNSLSRTNVIVASLLNWFRDEPWTWFIALIVGLLDAMVAGRYDTFRNELYFIVCGRHLDFGFVDQPPLVPLIATVTQLFGDSVWLLRLPAIVAAVALVLLAPIMLPLLDPAALARYLEWTHLAPPPEEVAAVGAPLTQILSHELGWRALEKQVAQVYRSLEPEERADEKVIIHVNGDPARWRRACESVEIAGNFGAPYVMPYENERPIFLCRGLHRPLSEVWERLRYE
jgi:hypothetical protein